MILSFSSRYRYFIYKSDCDMRKGFDGLSGLVESHFKLDPLHGDVFLFFNRPRNLIKILLWQGDGFLICHKRLEKGTFELPVGSLSHEITSQQVQFILEGIHLTSIKHRLRYKMKNAS